MKPSDIEIVSFEISHISLATIKLKSNVLFFFLAKPCGFPCFTLQAVLRINMLHRIILLSYYCWGLLVTKIDPVDHVCFIKYDRSVSFKSTEAVNLQWRKNVILCYFYVLVLRLEAADMIPKWKQWEVVNQNLRMSSELHSHPHFVDCQNEMCWILN